MAAVVPENPRGFRTQAPPRSPGLPLTAPDASMLTALLDHIPARVVVVGLDHRYLFVNREFCAFMDCRAEEVVGRHVADVLGQSTYDAYLPIVARLLAGEAVQWEAWVDYPGRGRRYVQEQLLPYNTDGCVSAIIAYGRDLTELKQHELSLAEQLNHLARSEAMKTAIVDSALAAIVTTDGEGRIVSFNPAAEAMFGLPASRAVGLLVADVMIPARDRAAHIAGMHRLAEGGPPRSLSRRLELRAMRSDGGEFPIEMVLWRTAVGDAVYYTASIVDMTERQRASELIERQREALRQSEKLGAMGSLLAGVAHELNNPLAIVLGRATLLEEKAAGLAPLQNDARLVREAAERCGRIVRTFLNMARQRPMTRGTVQINELAQAAADILAYSLRSHGIALTLLLDGEVPPVQGDGDQLGQIILNLLVNAQHALADTPPSARHVRLTTGVERNAAGDRATQVWLRVADHGPGVQASLRESIFEPFFTTKTEGTGLGLAVSRDIARAHGGELFLEEPINSAGASFLLRLPVHAESANAEGPDVTSLDPGDDAAPVARILVVDDEPEIADLLRALLEGAGHDVATAEAGSVALALLEEGRFDAVVSDLHMPQMDGLQLWREVRARTPLLAGRFLFVTGDTLSAGARSVLAQTGCASLAKPFTKADLLEQVSRLLA
jgi:PAS domain S-box-containing protein